MVEYDHKVCNKIFLLLKKYNYKKFIYNNRNEILEKHNKQKILNLFFIDTKAVRVKL